MPNYRVQAPDGRVVRIQAASPQAAMDGAHEWVTSNPYRSTPGSVAAQVGMGGLGSIASGFDNFAHYLGARLNPLEAYKEFTGNIQQAVDLTRMALAPRGTPAPPQSVSVAGTRALQVPGAASAAVAPVIARQPIGAAEKTARFAGSLAPSLLMGPGGDVGLAGQVVSRAANVVGSMAGSAGGRAIATALHAPPQLQEDAAGVGGLVGGGAANVRYTAKGNNPQPQVSPAIADIVNNAINDYGINLRPSQIMAADQRAQGVKQPAIAVQDSEMMKKSGTGFAANQSGQLQKFTRALANTFGEDADHITPDVAANAFSRIGGVFDDVGSRLGVTADAIPGLNDRLNEIRGNAARLGLSDSQLKALDLHIQDIGNAADANDGAIPGPAYLNLTNSNSPLSQVANNDHTAFGDSAGDIKVALGDAVAQNADPADVQALKDARTQYRALKTVQPLINNSEGGVLNPLLLRNRVAQVFGNRFTTGDAGALGDLARIGRIVGDSAADTNTAARAGHGIAGFIGSLPQPFASIATGAGASFVGAHAFDPAAAIPAAIAGGAVGGAGYLNNALKGRAMLDPAYRDQILGNAAPATLQIMPPAMFGGLLPQSGSSPGLVPDPPPTSQ